MEVRIGVVHTPKELTLDLDGGVDEAFKTIDKAIKGGETMVWLIDTKGRRVGVALDKLAYVEVDAQGIVRAINQVGAAPGDLVAILEALQSAGALRAELIVI